MILTEHVPLSSLTTLRVGGVARAVADCESESDVREALRFAREHTLPFYVLGDGSNVLARSEGFDGLIIRVRIGGISFSLEGDRTLVTAGAGVGWDTLVYEVAARGLWGIENLAGIPGTCGAAPVQNIGAYGREIKNVLHHVEVLDASTESVVRLSSEECGFGYRDSRFKHEPHLIILSIAIALSKTGAAFAEYTDLRTAKNQGADLSSPQAVGELVRAIRARKFPDLRLYGTAGSFFKNPILTEEAYRMLQEAHGTIPQFPHPEGIKIPLAFVLDKILGLRDYRLGRAFLFGAQPLVLTLEKGGTSEDVETLARDVERRVLSATGIVIEREVRTLAS